jgi:glutamate-ammonia-ligase adenylyltransferase
MNPDPGNLFTLLSQPSEDNLRELLTPVGFSDPHSAGRLIQSLAKKEETRPLFAELFPHLLAELSGAASPDRALAYIERFAGAVSDQTTLFQNLRDNPRGVEILVRLFSGSQFLAEILLRNPEYFERLSRHKNLARQKSVEHLREEAWKAMPMDVPLPDKLEAVRQFQRWEQLRIGTCDIFGFFDLVAVTAQLSNLAECLVQLCLELLATDMTLSIDQFAVIGMGKLGGKELNYSSDIDLLFIAETDAASFQRLGQRLIDALANATSEGFLYRVDMRLRPWGRMGALVTTLDGYVQYMNKHARLWEKQSLLKARIIAGSPGVGEEFSRRVSVLVYSLNMNVENVRSEVYAMKQLTESHLRLQGRSFGEVKLGEGSIRDIEFVTQFLQMAYGARQPEIRRRNTLKALRRLAEFGYITSEEQRVLADGYILLRTIEHYLQMMYYRQTNTLPGDAEALAYLSKRLGFQGKNAAGLFLARYQQHSLATRAIYLKYVGNSAMEPADKNTPIMPSPEVSHHLARLNPSYESTFSEADIERHATRADKLDSQHLAEVDATPMDDGNWRVTIVAFDYPGELSMICGLMTVYGLNIFDGNVFTYEPAPDRTGALARLPVQPIKSTRRKIVDVFTVNPVVKDFQAVTWLKYADDLASLLGMMNEGKRREAQGELLKRVAVGLQAESGPTSTLYPVDITIDNTLSDRYTVLRIDALDTFGFLYELTNALAFNQIYIAQVEIDSTGKRVHDTLYVTDNNGHKITSLDKQRELRAATVLIKHFTHLLPHSPNPESALLHFREFIAQLFQHPNWPDELASLERSEVLNGLSQLLGVSDFLWDDFLRMQYANLFPVVRDVDKLATTKSRAQLQSELETLLRPVHHGPQAPAEHTAWQDVLNAFKDREMFRIDMRHILGHTSEFWEFSEELTDLVEVVINAAYHLIAEDLRLAYGSPHLENGEISQMAVVALGKCGGRELGFASDIELMFIYAGNGNTSGPNRITTSEYYEKVVETFVSTIRARQEGIFQIDLQLRPYGKAGSMSVSVESFRRYFSPDGPAWAYERQALVKLRAIAGDPALGAQVEALRDQFIYTGEAFDVTAMRAMRERQIRHLVKGGTFHPKYSPGGLVDVEYLVQGLQITHGAASPGLRQTRTRDAMAALAAAGILSQEDFTRLRKAHTFLRWLIDGLRVVRGNAKDVTVPLENSEEFAFLARRLRYGGDRAQLHHDMLTYSASVQEINRRLLG